MDLLEAQELAEKIIAMYGLDERGVTFRWNRARRAIGRYVRVPAPDGGVLEERIELSAPWVLLNDRDAVEETIRHEVAHALAPHAGHGPDWVAACAVTGARPEPLAYDVVPVPPKWHGICPRCGIVAATRYRLTTRARSLVHTRCLEEFGAEPLRWVENLP